MSSVGGRERKTENETHNKVTGYCTFESGGVIHCHWNWNDTVDEIGIWNETLNWRKIQLVRTTLKFSYVCVVESIQAIIFVCTQIQVIKKLNRYYHK
jgi:hypothetical protein